MDTDNNIVNSNDSEKKQINITGQSNRYQIKKLTQEKKGDKKRIKEKSINFIKSYC
jgi:hypothetical protein